MLEVRLEVFNSEDHSQILRDWLHRPHVTRWWGDPQSVLESSLRLPLDSCSLIVAGQTPVGYMCWQTLPEDELNAAGLTDLPQDLMDIDVLIGEPQLLGRGLGPRSLSLLLERFRADPLVSLAGVGTSVSNDRAIRAFKKAGFRLYSRFQDPEFGPCLYMVAEVRDAA